MPLSGTLKVGISRNHAGANLEAWPGLLTRALAAGLGSPVQAVLAQDYEDLLGRVTGGAVDLAWLPPLLQARAAGRGARLVALPQREGWLSFRSALLVRKDDPVASPGDLRGVRAAWRDRSSASGYLFPRIELTRLGAPPGKAFSSEKFYGSVGAAAQAVVSGEADLCTCFVTDPAAGDRVRAQAEIARVLGPIGDRLRVLHVTEPIPPDGLVVGGHVPEADRAAVVAALLSLQTTPEGREVLRDVFQAERLAAVNETLLRSLTSWAEAAARCA